MSQTRYDQEQGVSRLAENTAISWAGSTWNTIYGCSKVSPGCARCYIERTPPYRKAGLRFERGAIPLQLLPERLDRPLHWHKPRRIFVNSLSDTFHEDVPDAYREQVFETMAQADWHQFLVLTKRPQRMKEWIDRYDRVLPNVWLGVTAENQRWADERIPILLDTPAAIRWASVEPLVGPVTGTSLEGLDWVVLGGESGPGWRRLDHQWARAIRDWCREAGVAYFGKQDSAWKSESPLPGDLGDREYPKLRSQVAA